jgi:nucleotide-binding universal stress UspA family protein
MSASRRFLVAFAGTEDADFPGQVANVVGPAGPDVEYTLLHVVEAAPRELAAHDPLFRRGPWPSAGRAELEQRMTEADEAGAAALLSLWQQRFESALPGTKFTQLVARGRPEQEIIAAARLMNADAVVLCARPHSGPTEPGPRSVGHVARFVVDHSPVAVLLIRRPA